MRVVVETPQNLTKTQRELLTKFAEASGEDVNPQSKSFFDKVKDLLNK